MFRCADVQMLTCCSPPGLDLRSLKEAFLQLLLSGSRLSDLQLRNDLLVITTLIAENPNSLLVVSEAVTSSHHCVM